MDEQTKTKTLSHVSRSLSWLLRHSAVEQGIVLHDHGFAQIKHILRLKQFKNLKFEEIEYIVKNDAKNRFSLVYGNDVNEGSDAMIRANQGHSIADVIVDNKLLQPILSESQIKMYKSVIHGTYWKCWQSIATNGLSRMNRNHIHFTCEEPVSCDDNRIGVRSGIRCDVDLLIYINLEKAINDSIKFYISSNGVILTPGNEFGFLQTKYFDRVLRIKPFTQIIEFKQFI